MSQTIERYLDKVLKVADLNDSEKELNVRDELRDHLEEKIEKLQNQGLPLEEAISKAIEDHGNPVVIGYKLRPKRFIDVRLKGTARGFVAIGPKAVGVIAIGGLATGIVACGGVGIGLFSFGGVALGLLATGGFGLGALVFAGLSIGLITFGGFSIGVIASGAIAIGVWIPGAGNPVYSYFSHENVPKFLVRFDNLLSYDGTSREETKKFFTNTVLFYVLLWTPCWILMTIQGVMTKKEQNRIKNIDPATVE